MTDTNAIASQFTSSYYQTFDTNRPALASLYRDESSLTYEGQSYQGAQAISEKLCSLPFQTIQHAVTTMDSQMTVDGGLLVFVVGQLKADNDPVIGFSQTFYLKQIGSSLFILNDIFRLALHHQ